MEPTTPSASVVDYDNALLHLIEAVTHMIKHTVTQGSGQVYKNQKGQALGLSPAMIALGSALTQALVFRSLAGAPGALSEEDRIALERDHEESLNQLKILGALEGLLLKAKEGARSAN